MLASLSPARLSAEAIAATLLVVRTQEKSWTTQLSSNVVSYQTLCSTPSPLPGKRTQRPSVLAVMRASQALSTSYL